MSSRLLTIVLCCALAPRAFAQDAAPPSITDAPAAEQTEPTPVPPPPPGYGATTESVPDAPAAPYYRLPPGPPPRPEAVERRVFNLWLGLGGGDAVGCGNEDPDSPCAVEGAFAIALGADYRFHPNFGVGLEISGWSFGVSDRWLGQLSGEQKSAEIGASSLSVIGRWYWFDHGIVDPYLQFGVGVGGMEASVTNNADQTYTYSASGSMWNLGVGGDFHVTPWFKLGPQLLAALLVGNKICETMGTDGDSVCRDAGKNDKGEEEGRALAWRLMIVGTVMLGER